MAIVNTHYGYCGGDKLPELAGLWVLNEVLSPTENNLFEGVNFTAGKTITTITENFGEIVIIPTGNLIFRFSVGGGGYPVYDFTTNTWTSNKYVYIKFDSGATASDEFRTWLASNAVKQG